MSSELGKVRADVLKAAQAADDLIAISTSWNDADVIALSNGYRALKARVQALEAELRRVHADYQLEMTKTVQANWALVNTEAQCARLVEALERAQPFLPIASHAYHLNVTALDAVQGQEEE